MVTQIPRPKPQIDRGATIQQSVPPIPPVQQPDHRRYAQHANALRFVVAAVVAIHQGSTVQPTHPTPTVTTRPEFRYYAPDVNRYVAASMIGPRAQVDQGPTRLSTDPVPPVTVHPSAHYYRYEPNRLLVGAGNMGPDAQVDGATVQPWFIYPVKQPDFKYYTPDPNRLLLGGGNMGPDPQTDGATRQQTFVFPISQPEAAYRVPLARSVAQTGPQAQLLTVAVAQTSIFPPNQPEISRFSAQHALRFVVDAPRQPDQGATVQPSFEFIPNQPEPIRYALRDLARSAGGPVPQLVGATVHDWFVYPVNEPVIGPGRLQLPPSTRIDVPIAVVQADVYPVGQPELIARMRLELARQLGGPVAQLEGAPLQQGYVFPVSQPEIAYQGPLVASRSQTGPVGQLLGVTITIAQTYLFPPNQPELSRFATPQMLRFVIDAGKSLHQGAAVQATSIFPPNQPEAARYAARELARALGGPSPQVDGATSHAWFIYPTGQPELRRYTLADPHRSLLLGPRPQLEGAIVDAGSFVFPVAQFDWRYAVPDVNRIVAELGPRRQVTGATTQQTYVFPVNQGERKYYVRVTPVSPAVPILGIFVPPAPSFEFAPNQPELRAYVALERARSLGGPSLQAILAPIVLPAGEPERFILYLRQRESWNATMVTAKPFAVTAAQRDAWDAAIAQLDAFVVTLEDDEGWETER